jgi:Mrp family chromosome partitioning ATPase
MNTTDEYKTRRLPQPLDREQKLLARRLAAHVTAAVERSGARTILVTSPSSGSGKTTLLQLIAPELEHIAPQRFLAFGRRVLDDTGPEAFAEDNRIKLIDGPSMLEADDFLTINDRWMSAFDGALIVVMGRVSRRSALETTVSWLQDSGIRPIGIIFNEQASPSLAQRIAGAWAWVRGKGVRGGARRKFQRVPS